MVHTLREVRRRVLGDKLQSCAETVPPPHRASFVDRRSWCCSHDSGRLPITVSRPTPPVSVLVDPAAGLGCGCCCCQCRSDRTSSSCSASSRTSCDCEERDPGLQWDAGRTAGRGLHVPIVGRGQDELAQGDSVSWITLHTPCCDGKPVRRLS